ncbi:MAG: hypothetical protein K2W92_02710 [Alphaproteobacteria bacterium]|nr:hypothetical protein [Alphaproteobacteria bacterium]
MKTQSVKIKINKTFGNSGYAGFEIIDVVINAEGRKNFRETSACEDGYWYTVSVWQRADGTVDKYSAILEEAKTNGLN